MSSRSSSSKLKSVIAALPLLFILVGPSVPFAKAEDPKPVKANVFPEALDKTAPATIAELKAIQDQVKVVLDKVMPCTVGLIIGSAQGSGVIIDKDGHVLTAGHVSGQPDRDVIIVMPDGKRLKGKTLGANRGIDSGMVKITDKGEYPFLEMGNSAEVKTGQWCIACGHPGGYKPGRPPVVRLGRLINVGRTALTSDCTLVGGDSGGPLFDLHGKVIGIHSRIGGSITANVHVPVDTFRDTFDRLVQGEAWGGGLGSGNGGRNANMGEPYLGVLGDAEIKDAKVLQVEQGSPAEKAGLKPNDIITKFDGQTIEKYEDLNSQIKKKKPGDEVAIEVQRGDEKINVKLVIGKKTN